MLILKEKLQQFIIMHLHVYKEKKLKILILGGSGTLSTDFTRLCLDNDNVVYLVNRGKRKQFIDERAKLIVANLRNEPIEDIKNKLSIANYDVIVDFLSYNVDQMKKTLAIVEGMYRQYIFISSATAYIKDNPNEIITEKNKIGNKDWDYAYNKSLCENFLAQQDINYTIIRPYVTYGISRIPFPIIPDGYHYTLLKRIIENKPILLYENGSAICTLTNTKDFAHILYSLLLNEKAYREDFHITSVSRQSWKDVYFEYCQLLGKEHNYISVSKNDIHKYLPEFEQILDGDKGQNMIFDNSKVMNAIGGYEFKYDLHTGLKESVDFYLKNKSMQGIDYKWDGRCDYLVKRLTGKKGHKIESNNENSNKKILYIIMTNFILRNMYETARKIKHVIR